tara:strand:- start:500 stop:2554 length:2055 start_codon:yes stop_codon:yes gene_type:complete
MAFASITYTSANGTTFALTNSDGNAIEYLRQNDISVTVNGTLQTVTTNYTFNAAGTSIVLNSAVTNATVVLARTTDIADATVSFTPGSTLTAADLNNSDKQNRFSLQEFSDSFGGLTSGTGDLSALAGFIGGSETWTSDDAHAATTAGIDARIDTVLTTDVSGGDGVTITDNQPGAGQIRVDLDADIATLRDMQTGAATQLAALTSTELAILDGATVTTDELNRVDATSSIQTQLDARQPLDAELTELATMGSTTAAALADLTQAEVQILDGATPSTNELNQLTGSTLTNTFTAGNTTDFPSSAAINTHVVGLMDSLGGFVAIADDQSFPTTNPDPSDNAGTVVSIADAGGLVINGSGTSTTGRTTGSATVTITGFPASMNSTTVQAGLGLQVQTTTTLNTYTYHKLIAREDDIIQLSDDLNDFNERYRPARATDYTTDNDTGDLYFNTTDNELRVFNGSAFIAGVASNATDVVNTPAGNIAATNVQAAINELDTEKLANNVSATDRVLGRSTAGAGVVEEIACTAAGRNLLDDADAAAQRTTLGLVIGTNVQAFDANNAVTDAAQTFTEPQRGTITAVTVAAGDTTEALDFENGTNNWALTLNNTASCELSNPANLANCVGQSGSIFVIQDGTGSRILTYANSWDFIAATPPTLSTAANAVDRIDYVVRSGTSIHAVFTANYS